MKTTILIIYSLSLIFILAGFLDMTFWYTIFAIIISAIAIYIIHILLLFIIPYDRENKISDLGAEEYINQNLTEELLNSIHEKTYSSVGCDNQEFNNIVEKYKSMFSSLENVDAGEKSFYAAEDYITLINKYIIYTSSNFILCFDDYIIYVFSDIILIFAKNEVKTEFLAAYELNAIELTFQKTIKYNRVVINDKFRFNLKYYEKYNTIFDAKIISNNWLHTNKDGSRNLRYAPRNNPMIFSLEYGEVTIKIGKYCLKRSFSRCEDAEKFVELFNCYKSNEILRPKITDEFNLPKFTETKNIRIQDKTVLQKLQDFIEKSNITKK